MKKTTIILAILSLSLSSAAWAGKKTPTPEQRAEALQLEQKGDLERTHKDYASAFSDYLSAAQLDPVCSQIFNKLGVTRLQLHDYKGAKRYLRHALALAPTNNSILNNLGTAAYMEKNYDQALRYLKQSLALNETNATCHLNIAEVWLAKGNLERAMTEYARALELDADILTSAQDGVVAQVRTPEQKAQINYLIAKAYVRRNNLDGALEYLERAKQGHFPDMHKIFEDKDLAPLWADPRLEKIVKR